IRGGRGQDVLIDGLGNDSVYGGGGDDVFIYTQGSLLGDPSASQDFMDGGRGFDVLYLVLDEATFDAADANGATGRNPSRVLTKRPRRGIARRGGSDPMFDARDDLTEQPPPVEDDPDGALVAAVARGESAAASRLVDRHLPRLTALAYRMLGDAHEAEDVAQEVFLRVWRNAAKWEPGRAKFSTWMHRVALNLCYDRLRKRRETPTDAIPERADDGPGPDAPLETRQLGALVRGAVDALPPRQRAAILLCHFGDTTNISAAETMGVSVEALESLLARGRRTLRKELSALGPDIL
ncbi:MAG: RNA polymerase sigma factor, partial [Pseudomonadota bacterium]